MAFAVEDFRDLLRILDQHPEWKAELRRAVLTDEILELPRIMRELAEVEKRTEQRLEALTVRVDALTAQVEVLTARVDALTSRVDELAEAQRRTEERLEALTARVDALTSRVDELAEAQRRTEETVQRLVIDVARLSGSDLERRFRENAPAYLSRRYRRGRLLSKQELMDALDDAVDEGRLSEAEAEVIHGAIRAVDAVIRARDPEGELWLVAEVSQVVDRKDVLRAKERAEALARLGVRTLPGVAGLRFTEGAESLLAEGGVDRWTLEALEDG